MALKAPAVIGFNDGEGGVEQFALGNDDNIEPRRDLVTTKNLSYQSLGAVSLDGAPELSCRGNAKTRHVPAVGQHEHCTVAPAEANATLVNLPKLRTTMNTLVRPKPSRRYSLLTVRRFRPFARRRLRTSRPFLVLIRTRNPCVRFLRRVLG